MSYPMNVEEAQGIRAISVADSAPGHATPAVTEISATGKRGIPVFVAPLHSQRESDDRGEMMGTGFQGLLILEGNKWFEEKRGLLFVLASLVASVTYQAGLNPPGGSWQDDGHAGNPVLRDMHKSRYMIFSYFYLNATAFVTSLVIMALLTSERFYHTEAKMLVFSLISFMDLISLIGAYIAGTTHFSSIYIIAMACVVTAGVIYMGEVMAEILKFPVRKIPCLRRMEQSRWFPVPAEVARTLQHPEEQ